MAKSFDPYKINPKPLIASAKKASAVIPDFPHVIFKAAPFDIRSELIEYQAMIADHAPMKVSLGQQMEVYDSFIDAPMEPNVIVVGSKFTDTKAKQLAAFMSLYWQMTCTVHAFADLDMGRKMQKPISKTCEWFPIYSNWDHTAARTDNPLRSSAFPVFFNVMDNSENRVLDKLRDAITAWHKYPRIIVYSGKMPPEEWVHTKLHIEAKTIWLGQSKLSDEL